MLLKKDELLPVHEFHHWDSTENGIACTATKPNGRTWDCAFANEHFYAGFPHLYWAGHAAVAALCGRRPPLHEGQNMTETELKNRLKTITQPDEAARKAAHAHWASLAKPLGGLGDLEPLLEDVAALTGAPQFDFSKRAVLVLCADNGVIAQASATPAAHVTRPPFCRILRSENKRLQNGRKRCTAV